MEADQAGEQWVEELEVGEFVRDCRQALRWLYLAPVSYDNLFIALEKRLYPFEYA